VTDQFLAYIEENQDAEPDYLSEFVIIAAKLVQIKSEALLHDLLSGAMTKKTWVKHLPGS
jgi:chromatin segregation and condensation protein Rec8/ScpA/Scc1 (kleisin family)